MHTVVYQHPLRTIWLTWELDSDSIPLITDYGDQEPDSPLPTGDTLILHSDHVHSHHFPGSGADQRRTKSEIVTFLPEIQLQSAHVRILPSSGYVFDVQWNTVLAWEKRDTTSPVISDIEADLAVLQSLDPTLFIGRRGSTWWFGAIDNQLLYLDRQPHPSTDLDHFLHENIDGLLSGIDVPIKKLTVFGDSVHPEMLKQLTAAFAGRLDAVERSNPFQLVRASLDDATASNIIRRAHLIGCMVAPMMSTSSLSSDFIISEL